MSIISTHKMYKSRQCMNKTNKNVPISYIKEANFPELIKSSFCNIFVFHYINYSICRWRYRPKLLDCSYPFILPPFHSNEFNTMEMYYSFLELIILNLTII